MTYCDEDNDGTITANDVRQINHYYPFGLNMEGNWNGADGKNKYQYNGKEWNDDFGLGWNHHDWRFLDVAINRFVTVDPEAESGDQKSWTPYHFGFNNPIRYDDPDGRNPIAGVYLLYRILRTGWAIDRALARGTPAQARAAQEIRTAESRMPVVATRDNVPTAIKPIITKTEEPVPIYIDPSKHPESAQHAQEAADNGTPLTGTIDRKGKDARRSENLKGQKTEKGKDRDEMPPAVVKPDGGVSVKNIKPSDNRGAGSSMGHQMKKHPDGTKVVITVKKQ